MNSTPLTIFGLLLAATLIGAASFTDGAKKHAVVESEDEAYRCPASQPEPKTIIGHSEVVFLGDDKILMFFTNC